MRAVPVAIKVRVPPRRWPWRGGKLDVAGKERRTQGGGRRRRRREARTRPRRRADGSGVGNVEEDSLQQLGGEVQEAPSPVGE